MDRAAIRIVLFSPFKELIGQENLEIPASGPLTVEEILRDIARAYPGLKKFLPEAKDEVIFWGNIVPIKNDVLLKPGAKVEPGDTIYLYPPLSGGAA
jgi:molybdopterin converting factor small subunit